MYTKALFIFRRDLRIEDNTALRTALEQSREVLACFIFTPEQIGNENTYRSYHAIQFMVESLQELADSFEKLGGRLYFFYGAPHDVVERLITKEKIDAVFVNQDYTPYSRKRDATLEKLCNTYGVSWRSYKDALLISPDQGLTKKGAPYHVFTPFYTKNSKAPIARPLYHRRAQYTTHAVAHEKKRSFLKTLYPSMQPLHNHGGRSVAKRILKNLDHFRNYHQIRNDLSQETTGLSAHNKFGTVSIREVAHAILDAVGPDNGLLRQLYWRDFFYHIAWFYPHVFGKPFQQKYSNLVWSTSKKNFAAWCEGTTGFPIVDAGMRQMNETGYMHNRARLIVGSFLTKDLHIHWRWGEKYFAQQLEDYDPCVNNGSWQWVASTGCDAQPYFRIFNPWLQQKRYDPECIYIKKWVPELQDVPNRVIHSWYKQSDSRYGYPAPMVDHKEEIVRTKERYKKAATT